MPIPLDQEIRNLRDIFWSDRDPDGRAFVPLADAYRRSGEFRKAVELLNDGLERHPEFASAHAVAARLYLEKGLVEEAEIAARRVLDLDEDNILGLELLAGALDLRGVGDEAASVRSHLAELSGQRPAPPVEAVEEVVEEDVVDLADLAPEAVAVEAEAEDEVMELAALAPDAVEEAVEAEEDIVDLADLAPEEEAAEEVIVDLAALAPEVAPVEDEVMEMAALAPDAVDEAVEAEEVIVDLADLAPEEEAPEEVIVDLAALAPDVTEEGADEEEDVVDLVDLAPEEELPDLAPADDLAALAPEEELADLGAAAPDASPEPSAEPSGLLPDEPVVELDDLAPAPGWRSQEDSGIVTFASDAGVSSADVLPDDPLPSDELSEEPRVVTRTMGELYARQGLTERALDVFRQLLQSTPGDPGLRRRIAELEAAQTLERSAAGREHAEGASESRGATSWEEDEGVAGHAWDAEAQQERHEVDTPFAWTEEDVEEAPADGPAIGSYFARLLAWEPAGGWEGDAGDDDADHAEAGPDGSDA